LAGEEVALLVGLHVTGRGSQRAPAGVHGGPVAADESMEELAALAATAGARVAERTIQSRPRIGAATLVGSGKVEELKAQIHFPKPRWSSSIAI
jgi:50S ribosomal subunit-associated GTPase HflX